MPLAELVLENLRCIDRAELTLAAGSNLIRGENASGKTSLLEGMYLLGRGRSFRTRNSERLIRHGQDLLRARGRIEGPPAQIITVDVPRREPTRALVAGVPVASLAALAQVFPVQIIEPGVHRLVEEGSPRRRRWLDWAVFHVEPSFVATWQGYMRAVRQRNAALRGPASVARAWDVELVRRGDAITELRRRLLAHLKPYWDETVQALADLKADLHYMPGWPQHSTLAEALDASWTRDASRGVTHAGPHRADIQILMDGRAARDVLSRGQQKLLATAMILSQLKMLRETTGIVPTLLLDDPAAELDPDRLSGFVAQVKALNCQLVLTSLEPLDEPFGPADRVFHVEHGRVKPL
jgi:DNA replication and repair protein RecF